MIVVIPDSEHEHTDEDYCHQYEQSFVPHHAFSPMRIALIPSAATG
jgi:hypothetical protein